MKEATIKRNKSYGDYVWNKIAIVNKKYELKLNWKYFSNIFGKVSRKRIYDVKYGNAPRLAEKIDARLDKIIAREEAKQ